MNDIMIKRIESKNYRFDRLQKKLFLYHKLETTTAASTQTAITIVNFVDRYERKLNKSWLEFTVEDIEYVFRSYDCKNPSTLTTYISAIRGYLMFTMKSRGISGKCSGYDALNSSRVCADVSKYMKGWKPKDYFPRLSDMNKLSRNIEDPALMTIMFVVYSGVKGKCWSDLTDVKLEDLDASNGIIYINDRKDIVYVEDELRDEFEKCVSELNYRYRNCISGIYLLRTVSIHGVLGLKCSKSHTNHKFRTLSNKLNILITLRTVYFAGVYYRAMIDFDGRFPNQVEFAKYQIDNGIRCSYQYFEGVHKSIKRNSNRLRNLK